MFLNAIGIVHIRPSTSGKTTCIDKSMGLRPTVDSFHSVID